MKVLYKKKQTAEKKNLINRISELTGVKPKYLGAPTMVYQIGNYQVDREGNLIAPDDQDAMELVETLKLYGFEEAIPEQEAAVKEAVEETTAEPTAATEDAETDVAEEAAKEVIAGAAEEIHEVEPAEEPIQQNMGAEATTDAEMLSVSIAFPLSKHTSQSLRNLVNLIYSRGALVSKAVQGEFSAPWELVDVFGDNDPVTIEEQVERLRKLEAEGIAMKGIRFEADKVIFTGFPETSDADILLAFQHGWQRVQENEEPSHEAPSRTYRFQDPGRRRALEGKTG